MLPLTGALDADRQLALSYALSAARPALEALWRLDVTLGAVLASVREPTVARIRLAWWREALEALDRGPPPAEPILQGLARHVLAAGITGTDLAAMEEGWAILLTDDPEALSIHAEARGGLLFRHSARLLGVPGRAEAAGACWALVDLARHTADPGEGRRTLEAAAQYQVEERWPPALRPLGMLATLAWRDIAHAGTWERQGSPGRMLRMLRHRLTGR